MKKIGGYIIIILFFIVIIYCGVKIYKTGSIQGLLNINEKDSSEEVKEETVGMEKDVKELKEKYEKQEKSSEVAKTHSTYKLAKNINSNSILSEGIYYDLLQDVYINFTEKEITNSVAKYINDDKYFSPNFSKDYWINKDGTLNKFTKITCIEYDRENRSEKVEEDNCELMALILKGNIKYYGDKSRMIYIGNELSTKFLFKDEEGTWLKDSIFMENFYEHLPNETSPFSIDGLPIYFNIGVDNGLDNNQFYNYKFKPGEKLEFTLIYLVPKEDINDVCIYLNPEGREFDFNNKYQRYIPLSIISEGDK